MVGKNEGSSQLNARLRTLASHTPAFCRSTRRRSWALRQGDPAPPSPSRGFAESGPGDSAPKLRNGRREALVG